MLRLRLHGKAEEAATRLVDDLVASKVASGIFAQDSTLWGPDAQSEAAKRLGWTAATTVSRALVEPIRLYREQLAHSGITRVVLAGMGGSSLAPEVICKQADVPLVVLDATAPTQVAAALAGDLAATVLVVSSKSGSTVETDSARRVFHAAFESAGLVAADHIVVVTDPGSPFTELANRIGYKTFLADPNVGGRYSALTAFGLVPAGLAGVDIAALLDDAESALAELRADVPANPALQLGAAIAGNAPEVNKLGLIIEDDSPLIGFGDWAEQLIAESTGKLGRGILPVVLEPLAPELDAPAADLTTAFFVPNVASLNSARHLNGNSIISAGSLGVQFMLWEVAVAVAGCVLGINPFDQPDVEAAKAAARGLLDARPEPTAPAFVDGPFEVRGSDLGQAKTVSAVIGEIVATLGDHDYIALQAYADREAHGALAGVRALLAARAKRPVTFGWGPRFLHSTGQYHKGGPAQGFFVQIIERADTDVTIPERPFSYGALIAAQAAGDAQVLRDHGRVVVSITLDDLTNNMTALFDAVGYNSEK